MTADDKADIYGEIDFSEIGSILKLHGVKITHATERDEDLEAYYINLLGGDING